MILSDVKPAIEALPYVKEFRIYGDNLQGFVVFKNRLKHISVLHDAYQGWIWRGNLHYEEPGKLDQVREFGRFIGVDKIAQIGLA